MMGKKCDSTCAWGIRDANESHNTSHGICDDHAEQVLLDYEIARFNKVPSFVGERQKFDSYIKRKNSK